LSSFIFLITTILRGVRGYLTMILIHVFLMIRNYLLFFFTYLLAICVFFWEMYVQFLCSFLNQVSFCLLNFFTYIFWRLNSLSDTWFLSIIFHSIGCLLTFWLFPRLGRNFLVFVDCVLRMISKKKKKALSQNNVM
jgi:hypothetical protein